MTRRWMCSNVSTHRAAGPADPQARFGCPTCGAPMICLPRPAVAVAQLDCGHTYRSRNNMERASMQVGRSVWCPACKGAKHAITAVHHEAGR